MIHEGLREKEQIRRKGEEDGEKKQKENRRRHLFRVKEKKSLCCAFLSN